MACYLGIDTSNYTTSAALYFPKDNTVKSIKRPLPVKAGDLGLRQSEALFQHTLALPLVLEELFQSVEQRPLAVGVSVRPCDREGSYFPCFLAGISAASAAARALGVPLYENTHQQGHIAAALYSADRLDLMAEDFIAFHVSGGTTEVVKVSGRDKLTVSPIASSLDLKAGQAIDRLGKLLSMPFPSGKYIDEAAQKSKRSFKPRPFTKDGSCSLSGLQNQYEQMLKRGEPTEDICRFAIAYIEAALRNMLSFALDRAGELPVVFSGGVMSNSIIRENICRDYKNAVFALPQFSSDNAAGVAFLAMQRHIAEVGQ